MSKQYQFKITHTDLNSILGATTPPRATDGTADITVSVDRGFSRQISNSLLTAKFGDGYEQRALNGINTKQEQISVSFNNRDYKEGNLIAAFFDLKAGLNFNLTVTNTKDVESSSPTETTETIKVTCDEYNLVYVNDSAVSIQTTFRRVYEPTA